jgi:hypothetical protein
METLTDEQKYQRKLELARARQKKWNDAHREEIRQKNARNYEYRKEYNKKMYQAGKEFRKLQKMIAEGKAEIFFDCQV